MGEPKLVIFDCDGTLVDSQHLIVAAMQTAFRACGLDSPADGDVRAIIGLSLPQAVAALADPADGNQLWQLGEAYKQAFIDQRARPDFHEPLFPGARAILDRLALRDDVLLAVATGKSRRGVDVLFEREGLNHLFHSIQTADDAPSKPHPGMVQNALAETGVSATRALMVGDTSFDMQMACGAGIRAIGVSWGCHPREQLHAAGASHVIEVFDELLDMVDQLTPMT